MDVLIVGGGVLGMAAAYYLAREGLEVTLVEAGEIGRGCSYGNAGLLVPSYITPLATPQALRQGLGWLFDPHSPLRIRPRPDPSLFTWLARFALASRERRVAASIRALRRLSLASLELYEELAARDGERFHFGREGWLHVYRTEAGLGEARLQADRLAQAGIPHRQLDGAEVRELEPALTPGIVGGIHYPEDAHLDPFAFLGALAERAREAGAELHSGVRVSAFRAAAGRIRAALTPGAELEAGHFVLAAGSWSGGLARSLGLQLPLQPAKGYSLTLHRPEWAPSRPLMLGEPHVVATPMGSSLRLTGGLDLVGFEDSASPARVESLRAAARTFLPPLRELDRAEPWYGYRPLTPDGLPLIGPSRRFQNLLLATGHGTLGMTLAPVTGRLIAELLTGARPAVELKPFLPARFSV